MPKLFDADPKTFQKRAKARGTLERGNTYYTLMQVGMFWNFNENMTK